MLPHGYADEILFLAKIAQLVEHDLAKVGVAGSSPVFRSKSITSRNLGNSRATKGL